MLVPPVPSKAEWPSLRRGFGGWHAAVREICLRHRLRASALTPVCSGTNVVFVAGSHVVKLYPPFWEDAAHGERSALELVDGRLGISTPEVIASGHLEAWPYLVVRRLDGVFVADVSSELTPPARHEIVAQLGGLLAKLHALPVDRLRDVAVLSERWSRIARLGSAGCVALQRARGVAESWVAQIPAFLVSVAELSPKGVSPVLVNNDVHPWHLLVTDRDGKWRLSGLIDFDDAMLGWRECEFAAPTVFLTVGDAALLATCLSAYGYARNGLDGALRRRLVAYALMNPYWGLDVILEVADPAGRCATLEELEHAVVPMQPA